MQWSQSAEYGFALGRVRALEPSLFDRPRYERFITAADSRELVALVVDAGYGRYAGRGEETSLDEMLSAAQRENAAFLYQYCRLLEVRTLFFLAADLNRLKAAVKQRLGARHPMTAAGHGLGGTWTDAQLAALAAAQAGAQPEVIRLAVARVLAAAEPFAPETVDSTLDIAGQQYLLQVVNAAPFLRALAALRADLANLRALVRSRAVDEPPAALASSLLPGGNIDRRTLAAAGGADWEGVVAAVRDTRFGGLVADGVAFLREQRSLVRLERLTREEEIRFLRQTRYVAMGYEPLLAFCLQREAEITNLRLLHAAKLTGMPAEACREVVAYVN
uniref:V-type ATPase subunit n=1 Tax=candidate division WOR-3 bacterium TaxID=2052148 RepID=A0A7C4CA86_UNCW3